MAISVVQLMGVVNTAVANVLVPELDIPSKTPDPDEMSGKRPKGYVLDSVYPNEEIRDEAMKYLCGMN